MVFPWEWKGAANTRGNGGVNTEKVITRSKRIVSESSCDGKKTAKTEARKNIYIQNSNDLNFMFKKGHGEKVGYRPEVEDKRTERESECWYNPEQRSGECRT